MRTGIVTVVVIAATLCATSVVGAEPSLNGFTGLLATPTAETLDERDYSIGVNSSEVEDWDDFNYYANFGLGEETEVGLVLFRTDRDNAVETEAFHLQRSEDETYIHVKRALSVEGDGPRIAAGVFDLTDEVETTVYVVASWEQGRTVGTFRGDEVRFLNLHVGVAAGMFEDFFAGAELTFGPRVEILAEFIEDDFNVGARLKPAEDVNLDAGLIGMEDLAINVSYSRDL